MLKVVRGAEETVCDLLGKVKSINGWVKDLGGGIVFSAGTIPGVMGRASVFGKEIGTVEPETGVEDMS